MVYSSVAASFVRPSLSRHALSVSTPSVTLLHAKRTNMMTCSQFHTEAPNQVLQESVNETRQYLDRLKDAEIEFQSQGEHVSGDFWNSEPGNYRANYARAKENDE